MSVKAEWQLPKQKDGKREQKLSQNLDIPPFIARLLINHGINTLKRANTFLHPKLTDLGDPFQMHDMKKGVKRIKRAIKLQERIVVYGDYDADGITSVSIMYSVLKKLNANVHYFLPDRFRDNYGPNMHQYHRIVKEGTKLLITTDNGISGLKEIAYARKAGMDVIITDHHDFPPKLPNANAIIMEKYPGHEYRKGKSDFCGAGIAFKVAQALLGRVPTEYLDIVALGTIADSVNLKCENRVLVALGLKKIHHDDRKGVRGLAGMSNTQLDTVTSTDLQFSLIPRLNAIGRMSNPTPAVEMLTTTDAKRALAIAQMIEQFNNSRKSIMNQETKEALAQAEEPQNKRRLTLVLYSKNWFPGVVGIIASKVSEKTGKPVVVIGHLRIDDKALIDRGSGRSVEGFDLFKAMNPLQQGKNPVMESFGGHPFACGLSIKPYNIQRLADGLEKAGYEQHLDKLVPKVKPELCLTPTQINRHTLDQLQILEPFGVGNESPLIDLRLPNIYHVNQMGKTGNHLSFTLGRSWKSVKVVAFGMGDKAVKLHNNPFDVEVAGTMSLNRWKHRVSVQFMAKHIRYYVPRPTMNEIKSTYKYLYVQHAINFGFAWQGLYEPIGGRLGIRPDKIRAIINMFIQLNLMYIDDKTLQLIVVQNPIQCKLTDSSIYQKMQE